MDKRIFYKIEDACLNGASIRGLRDVEISTTFELMQCFCGCPHFPSQAMRDEFEFNPPYLCGWLAMQPKLTIEVHRDDCPNANQDRLLRYLTEDERNQYALGQ